MSKTLPRLTHQPVEYVDATPDADYPLRILRVYRQHADCCWEVHDLGLEQRRFYDLMNADNRRRVAILDRAIAALSRIPSAQEGGS